jgi:hypothetical protein
MPDPDRAPRGPRRRTILRLSLLGVLAIDYLTLGLTSTGATRALGIAGALLVGAGIAMGVAGRPLAALGAILLGAVPLAVLTSWSIVTPTLGVVTLAIAAALAWHVHRTSASDPTEPRSPDSSPSAA